MLNNNANETKYYLLSWYNVTPDEEDVIDALPKKQARRRFNALANAYIKSLPEVTGNMLKKLTAIGADPKFIQNLHVMGITFKTDKTELCDSLKEDPHVIILDAPQELYEDPDSFYETRFGKPSESTLTIRRMDIGTIVPKL